MNGLDILLVGIGARPRGGLADLFAGLGHTVSRADDGRRRFRSGASRPDLIIVDAVSRGVEREEVRRIRTGFQRPVLVIGERPACLSGIPGAMFCFADASDRGHELALHMCLALSPVVTCPRRSAVPGPCGVSARALSPARWRDRPAARGCAGAPGLSR